MTATPCPAPAHTPAPAPARAGRPTREHARTRHAELLEVALDHFLEKGFEPATIEAIATSMSMTKRTVYALYPDKATLFRAAVRRAIEQLVVPAEQLMQARTDDPETTLINFAYLRIDLVTAPSGLKLQRIIHTESYRFPDISTLYYELAALPVIHELMALFEEETLLGRMAITEPMLAAQIFFNMVVSGPVRIILSGNHLTRDEITHRVRYATRLFLNGARPR